MNVFLYFIIIRILQIFRIHLKKTQKSGFIFSRKKKKEKKEKKRKEKINALLTKCSFGYYSNSKSKLRVQSPVFKPASTTDIVNIPEFIPRSGSTSTTTSNNNNNNNTTSPKSTSLIGKYEKPAK
jgi:hypothetical protein